MKSHGEEFTLSTRNIVTKDFTWSTDFIFSHTKSRVTDLDAQTRIYDLIYGNGFTMKGYPYRALFSMDFKGLNNSGLPTFVNEKGEITTSDIDFQSYDLSHLKYEGPTDPTITGSLGNVFSYKNWHLNIFMTYSFGNVTRLDPSFAYSYSDLSAMLRSSRQMGGSWRRAENYYPSYRRPQNNPERYISEQSLQRIQPLYRARCKG